MAGRIPQQFIDDLLSRLDVVDIVDSRVKLKKTGKNYSACCPFHNEKSPSFTVSPDKQFYYCFGCGATGSAIKFVMEFDGLSFPDTVEKLAQQAGMEVPREQVSFEARQEIQHLPLFEKMEQSQSFFEQMLRQHEQRNRAVNYLKQRGLSGKAAKFFGIGYAPPGWDSLDSALKHSTTDQQQLIACGMLIEKEDGRVYDRFRDRIMFPIRDARGRCIAFGGRVLGDEKPKYLNSPETPIFHKNRELYGLFEARKIRQKLTRFIIVEGYMDVVALAEFGIHYAVATLGTATSEHHLRRLFKIVPEVIFCFDGDNAGRQAANRAMETVLPVLQDGVQARFLFLPDGEDPDTLVRQEGKEAFEERLNNSIHLPEFLFSTLKQQVDFDTLDGKARLDQLAAPLINRLPAGMLKTLMIKQLENEIGASSVALAKQNETTDGGEPATHTSQSASDIELPPSINHADDYSRSIEDDESVSTPLAALVEKALHAIVQQPELANHLTVPDTDPQSDSERLLFEVIRCLHQNPQKDSVGLLINWTGRPFHQQLKQLAEDINSSSLPITLSVTDISQLLLRIENRQQEAELNRLNAKFSAGQKLTVEERQRQRFLTKQHHTINKKRTSIYRKP